jgi:hypothetical protein
VCPEPFGWICVSFKEEERQDDRGSGIGHREKESSVSSSPYLAYTSGRKWQELPLWVAGGFLAVVCVLDGVLQLSGRSLLVPLPAEGLPAWLPAAVACIEIIASLCLFVPWLVSIGAGCLGVIMAGGVVAHWQAGNGLLLISPVLVGIGLAIIGYELSQPVSSLRRLRSILNAFAEDEILREELRRQSLPKRPSITDRSGIARASS